MSYRHVCFSRIKAATTGHVPFSLPSDVSEKTSSTRKGLELKPEPKSKAPEFDTCNFLVEAVSPVFVPNRFLLRRVVFISEDKPRYVSFGFYPTHNYQLLVEFGGSKIKPVILTDQHVATMAEYLLRICEAMCDNG